MQQRVEEFVQKTPFERLRAIVKNWWWPALLVLFVTLAVIPYNFIGWQQQKASQVQQEFERLHRETRQVSGKAALALLDDALVELRKQDANKEKAIERIEQAKEILSGLLDDTRPSQKRSTLAPDWNINFITRAYAQSPAATPAPEPTLPSQAKRWLLGGVLAVLAIVFILCVVAIFITKDTDVLRFAFDTVKTLMGFFIGVATTLIGT
jgi:hypothetical protein